jgi:hypothetical protein
MEKKFKVGQRVEVVKGYCCAKVGMTGVIIHVFDYDSPLYQVKFDKKFPGGHDCAGKCKYGYGHNLYTEHLKLIEKSASTKYKPGDVVTVRSDLAAYTTYAMEDQTNSMDATEQMVTKAGKKVKIKSVTKTGKYMIEGSIFPWVDGMFVDESKVEPKKTSEPRFKVGDRIEMLFNEAYAEKGMVGTIVALATGSCHDYAVEFDKKFKGGHTCDGKCKEGFGHWIKHKNVKAYPVEKSTPKTWKLIIRGEGDKTTAEYRCGDVTKKAEVNRFHEDQYSVHKAVEAVTNKVLPEEKWVVGVKFDGGKKVYDYTTTDNTIKAGDKVVVATGFDSHHVAVTVVWIKTYEEYAKASKGIELKGIVRKCERGDEPTYYNGKVVCVYRTPGYSYTEGKIYQAVDGKIRIDNGNFVPFERAETFKDFAEKLHGLANFVEIVE